MKRLYDSLTEEYKKKAIKDLQQKTMDAQKFFGINQEPQQMTYGGIIKHDGVSNTPWINTAGDENIFIPEQKNSIYHDNMIKAMFPEYNTISGLSTSDKSNLSSDKNPNNNTMDYISAGLQGLAALTPLLAKKNYPKYARVSPEKIKYNDFPIRKQSADLAATLKDTTKSQSLGKANFLQNSIQGLTALNDSTAKSLVDYRMAVDNQNTAAANRGQEVNAGIQERETEQTAKERDASYMAKERAAKDVAYTFANMNRDIKSEKLTKEQWDYYLRMAKLMYPDAASKLK